MKFEFDKDNISNVWFTADHHFGHENIIKFCDRPFTSIDEMDGVLIENWNYYIEPEDIVFHLGDLTLGDNAKKYLDQLNGTIYMLRLRWHHDKRWNNRDYYNLKYIAPLEVIYLSGYSARKIPITLSHYPMAEWDASYHGAWHLHGHSHGNHKPAGHNPFIIDVGVDCWNYEPVMFCEIIERMQDLGWKPE